ncbi:acyltransferase [Sphingomonas sp. LB-2]|uniref:acyltransferase family protein n=1 Tax=Sphingomonas caeni TaxID=2984949 RepID=UPI00222EE3A2|nr:acyltransferase [Sphingomonas caeni]MCW3849537.1 acyltransferase [Sphingomonas caeni]
MTFESPSPSQGRKLAAIQYLRGIAAAMVLVAHCIQYSVERVPALAWAAKAADYRILGVAVFFIISGFIMYYTCRDSWAGNPASAGRFLKRRLHRIVPLYWLLTGATLALLLAGKGSAPLREILLSLGFIPYDFDGLKFRPILGVGWTLDYEMFFYLLFAFALLFPKRLGLPLVLALIAGTVALGQTGLLGHGIAGALAQPIVALFGLGILVGWSHERFGGRLTHRAGIGVLAALMLVSLPILWAAPPVATQLWPNWPLWGLSLVVVAAAAFTTAPDDERRFAVRAGLLLGDASYFLYLVHVLVMLVMEEIGERLGLVSPIETVALALAMFAASITAGIIGHKIVEKPLTRLTAPLFGHRKAR